MSQQLKEIQKKLFAKADKKNVHFTDPLDMDTFLGNRTYLESILFGSSIFGMQIQIARSFETPPKNYGPPELWKRK